MDTTWTLLQALRNCVVEKLEPKPCRSFIHPGPNAPWDVCEVNDATGEDGQAWVAHLRTTPNWPAPTQVPQTCPHNDTAQFEVGVVRCAQGKLDDNGNPPPVEEIDADSEQQQQDRWALREAIACCFPIEGRDLLFVDWNATSPLGGCVGGMWNVLIKIGNCSCREEM